jgi:Uma2 family endonuclease
MGTALTSTAESAALPTPVGPVPELHAGDRLTRAEFERRYTAMPHVKKAELIEGVVYMPPPASRERGGAHFLVVAWLGTYLFRTPGVEGLDNATVRLDLDNEPQPDALLRIRPDLGGQSRDDEKFIGGPPELVAEVAVSSASYDLHDKLHAYRRNGVREYVVWRVEDRAVDSFILREGRYDRLALDAAGVYRSEVFPGLWLDPAAMIAGDMARVMAVLEQGIASPEHGEFVRCLEHPCGVSR